MIIYFLIITYKKTSLFLLIILDDIVGLPCVDDYSKSSGECIYYRDCENVRKRYETQRIIPTVCGYTGKLCLFFQINTCNKHISKKTFICDIITQLKKLKSHFSRFIDSYVSN